MNRPLHAIGPSAGRGMSTQRLVGIGFVVLLHVAAIWALVNGMVPGILKKQSPDITITDIRPEKHTDAAKPPPTTIPILRQDYNDVVPPPIDIRDDAGPTILLPPPPPTGGNGNTGGATDVSAQGIASTHTTPDYPAMARKMGEQGRVQLRLSISAQGTVTAADVLKSSGYGDLDRSAVDWVIGHWRYKPATLGGAAVASIAQAVVVFNLKNAG